MLSSVFNKKALQKEAQKQLNGLENKLPGNIKIDVLFKSALKLIHGLSKFDQDKVLATVFELIQDLEIKELSMISRYRPIFELAVNFLTKENTPQRVFELSKQFMKDLAKQQKQELQKALNAQQADYQYEDEDDEDQYYENEEFYGD